MAAPEIFGRVDGLESTATRLEMGKWLDFLRIERRDNELASLLQGRKAHQEILI